MEFRKNKFRVICFYIIAFVIISFLLWTTLTLFIKGENMLMFFAFGEIVLIISFIINKNALIGELNQVVFIYKNKVKCKNFFVAGNLADAEFDYNQIKSIQLKQTLFARCLIVRVKGSENVPVVLNNQFKDYVKLWIAVFDGCKSQKSDTYIDLRTYNYLNKHSNTTSTFFINEE